MSDFLFGDDFRGCDNLYGNFRTRKFTDVFPAVEDFLERYGNVGIEKTISSASAKKLYYLLYSRYGNSHFAGSDETQCVYKIFATIFQFGPTWEKELEIQNKVRNLSEDELITGTTQIMNQALNPGTSPNTSSLEELKFINAQNVSKTKRSKIDAYAIVESLLKRDVTGYFLDKFQKIFITVTLPESPLWFSENIESHDPLPPEPPAPKVLYIKTLDTYSVKGFTEAKVYEPNLIAKYIKKGISILGITGDYSPDCPVIDLRELTVKSDEFMQEIEPEGFAGYSKVFVNPIKLGVKTITPSEKEQVFNASDEGKDGFKQVTVKATGKAELWSFKMKDGTVVVKQAIVKEA